MRTLVIAALLLAGGAVLRPLAAQQPSRDSLLAAAREVIASVEFAALVTLDRTGHPRVRTMDPFPPDSNMVVWLGTNRYSRKVQQIQRDPRVTLYYPAPGGSGYVTILGAARIVDDPAEKARRWKPEWEAFYPDRDETYLLIEVTPVRLEIVSYPHNLTGDPQTWTPFAVEFPAAR